MLSKVALRRDFTHDAVARPSQGAGELGSKLDEDLLHVCIVCCHRLKAGETTKCTCMHGMPEVGLVCNATLWFSFYLDTVH